MQGRLAFCIRASVLSLALFACSTGEPTSPEDPEDPEVPPIPSTVRWSEAVELARRSGACGGRRGGDSPGRRCSST